MYLLLLPKVGLSALITPKFRLRGLNSSHKGNTFYLKRTNYLVATVGHDSICNIQIGQGPHVSDKPATKPPNPLDSKVSIIDTDGTRIITSMPSRTSSPNNATDRILRMLAQANREPMITTDNVGNLHGAFFFDETGFSYSDFNAIASLGPGYTSKLNGVELEPGTKYPLRSGDKLQIGDYEFVFEKSGIIRSTARNLLRTAASLIW